MRRLILPLAGTLLLNLTMTQLGAEERRDPGEDRLRRHLIPPELYAEKADELGLSEAQSNAIEEEISELKTRVPDLEAELRSRMETLEKLIADSDVSDTVVLEQLDRVLDQEREIKRLHIGAVVRMRSQLTSSQLATAKQLMADHKQSRHDTEQRLRAKVQRVQQLARQQAVAGRPPRKVAKLMETFQAAIQNKDPIAAEIIVDKALQLLAEDESEE